MKKIAFGLILLGFATSAFATWYNPVTVGNIRVASGGRVFFQTSGFNDTRWWTFDGNTAGGKNMFTILLTARTSNLTLRFDGTTSYTGTDRPTTDTFNCAQIQH